MSAISVFGRRWGRRELAYAGGFVHVDPGSVDVEASIRTVEHRELVRPVTDDRNVSAPHTSETTWRTKIIKMGPYSETFGWNQSK